MHLGLPSLATSARWSRRGPLVPDDQRNSARRGHLPTISGSHNPSATPYSLSAAVPATAKSLGVVIHPILDSQAKSRAPSSDSRVHGRDERFRFGIKLGRGRESSNDRFDEEWSESFLI